MKPTSARKPAKRPAAKEIPGKKAKPPPPAKSKIELMLGLLQSAQGASLPALMKATGWQAHSVRGALSGAIKKGRGLAISSEKIGGARIYRVAA